MKKEEKKKDKKVIHPMSKENAELLNNIENLIKWKLSSTFTSNTYKNVDENDVDSVLYHIFSELEKILKTQNSWDDLYNLSRIYYSYASMKLFVSSLARLINRYIQRDDESRDTLFSFIVAAGKDYLRWVNITGLNKHNASELEKLISFMPFISFFLDNIDCSIVGNNVLLCKISIKPADKKLLEFVSQVLSDVLSEIGIYVNNTQISESGQFSILTLEIKE